MSGSAKTAHHFCGRSQYSTITTVLRPQDTGNDIYIDTSESPAQESLKQHIRYEKTDPSKWKDADCVNPALKSWPSVLPVGLSFA